MCDLEPFSKYNFMTDFCRPRHLNSYISLMCFVTTALTVSFDNETYTVYENVRIIRLPLVLSDPSPFVETVQVMDTDITANGMYTATVNGQSDVTNSLKTGFICTEYVCTINQTNQLTFLLCLCQICVPTCTDI